MNVTIIPHNNGVTVDNVGFAGLDLSSCNIPAEVTNFTWSSDSGDTLPEWATACLAVFNIAKEAHDAVHAEFNKGFTQPKSIGTQSA
jgi:hypothetical protein